MTEYDYSPAAYERHMEKLARVEHWVTKQRDCAPAYSNPFVPRQPTIAGQPSVVPPAPAPRGSYRTREHIAAPPRSRALSPESNQGTHTRYSSDSRSRSQPRAAPARSQTMPNQHRGGAVVYPSKQYPYPQQPHVGIPPVPHGANAIYRTYEYDPRSGKDIVLPPPRPGETYVIVPPGARKVEVVVSPFFVLPIAVIAIAIAITAVARLRTRINHTDFDPSFLFSFLPHCSRV